MSVLMKPVHFRVLKNLVKHGRTGYVRGAQMGRLEEMGYIEPTGSGGWRITEFGRWEYEEQVRRRESCCN